MPLPSNFPDLKTEASTFPTVDIHSSKQWAKRKHVCWHFHSHAHITTFYWVNISSRPSLPHQLTVRCMTDMVIQSSSLLPCILLKTSHLLRSISYPCHGTLHPTHPTQRFLLNGHLFFFCTLSKVISPSDPTLPWPQSSLNSCFKHHLQTHTETSNWRLTTHPASALLLLYRVRVYQS